MTILGPLILAIASIAVLLGLMALVRVQARRADWSAELQRKIVHVGTGLYALALPLIFAENWPILVLLALTLAVMVGLRLPALAGIGAALHSVERKSYGDFFLAIAVGLVLLLSRRDPLLYTLPLAVLTLSDAAAALAGSAYGRRFFATADGRKSIEGSAIFFMVTLIVAMICLLLLSDIPRANVVVMALMVAAFGTLVEADSWHGFDNLFLPLGILLFVWVHQDRSPLELAGVLAVFGAALIALHLLAPVFRFNRHVVRVYLVAAFLILSTISVQYTVLPLMSLALHAGLRNRPPQTDASPELDAVAALAFVSFGWLVVGEGLGMNAVNFYAMTSMGICFGLIVLSLPAVAPLTRAMLGFVAGGALVTLWATLARINPEIPLRVLPALPGAALSLALVGLPAFLRPATFGRNRIGKLTALALVVPAVAYVFYYCYWTAMP